MESLSAASRPRIERMAEELAGLAGVVAVALAGSHARGRARPDSDVDLGIYYRESAPPELLALRACAADWNDEGAPSPSLTGFYEWGPWMNGGAWLHCQGERVDWIYRELGKLAATLDDLMAGRLELHWGQQPPVGFSSLVYASELHVCRPLHDPEGALAALKTRVETYPEALRESVVRGYLRNADFTLMHARSFASRGDVANSVSCLTRVAFCLNQVIFAQNRRWYVHEKTALEEIDEFEMRPTDYRQALVGSLAHPGSDADSLGVSVEKLVRLFHQVATASRDDYQVVFVA